MSPRNGVFDHIEIEPEFRKYVYQTYLWREEGHEITNFMLEKMGSVQFRFETESEKLRYENRIDDMIHVVVKD